MRVSYAEDYNEVLASYGKNLPYLDDKILIYHLDWNLDGYNDVFLTSSNSAYSDFSRFGLKGFELYLSNGKDDYYPGADIALHIKDDFGYLSSDNQQRFLMRVFGLPNKEGTKIHYYWIENSNQIYTTNDRPEKTMKDGRALLDTTGNFTPAAEAHKKRLIFVQEIAVDQVLMPEQKVTKQFYKDSVQDKLWVSSGGRDINGVNIPVERYEWIENEGKTYLGDFVGSQDLFYPANEEVATKFFLVLIQHRGSLKEKPDGTVRWRYWFSLAPDWAKAHPNAAAEIERLKTSCLPREVCELTRSWVRTP